MTWVKVHYGKDYASGSRETFRRQSIHQFMQAGLCVYNPDEPDRPVNSPKAVYQIEPAFLALLRNYGTTGYVTQLSDFFTLRKTLVEMYAKRRTMSMTDLTLTDGKSIMLSAGGHSLLIKSIIEQFAPRFVSSGHLVYIGDTNNKNGFCDVDLLLSLGVKLDNHGKFPDVIIYSTDKNWLFLIESVTSHGPVDSKRHTELGKLFSSCTADLVYISAFPNRKTFFKFFRDIAWETEVWVADSPTHLIHFNGAKFLGPYDK